MFSKKPAPETRTMSSRASASRASGGATFSILGPDIRITGDISASADLHIDGTIEGDISCQALVQGETSEIVGGITAESARLAGIVRGSIATRELVILRTARIQGDVIYDALTIEQGAQVDGRLSPRAPAIVAGAVETAESHLILASSSS